MLGAAAAMAMGLAACGTTEIVIVPIDPQLAPLTFMIGEWKSAGDSSGAGAGGTSSIESELNGRIVVRRDHVLTRDRKAFDVYMVIYPDNGRVSADFMDTEGHTIHYAMTSGPGLSVVFESPASAAATGYRLTYSAIGVVDLHVRFEIAPPGGTFKTYTEGDMVLASPDHRRRH